MKTPLTVILLLFVTALAQAQVDRSAFLSTSSDKVTISNYYFAKPNELTITVNVMGFVQRPGRYEISPTIDLVNLLALAGGATIDGDMDDVKVTRFTEGQGKMQMREFFVDLGNIARANPADLVLQPGDIVQIQRTGWSKFRDTFGFVVSAAIITTAISQVIIATRR